MGDGIKDWGLGWTGLGVEDFGGWGGEGEGGMGGCYVLVLYYGGRSRPWGGRGLVDG